MKLFTFLIIDDSVIDSMFIKDDPYEGLIKKLKNNRIYYYKEDKSIILMSFKYPNIKRGSFRDEKACEWAYVLIDNVGIILRAKNWSGNSDKKGNCIHYEDLQNGLLISYDHYLRIGGHVGAGRQGEITYRLHELIMNEKEIDEIRKASKTVMSEKSSEVLKTIEILRSLKNSRIHHKGYSFDNRTLYPEHVNISIHRYIHNKWEKYEKNNIFRPKKIELGEHYTEDLHCNCSDLNCENCSAVLQFKDFIKQLNSNEYKILENRIVPIEYY